jgi:hypothetical protein
MNPDFETRDEIRTKVCERYAMGFRVEVIAQWFRISPDAVREHLRVDKHIRMKAEKIRKEQREKRSKLIRCAGTHSRTGEQWC